ncbi:hydrogenase formation protein HypD [Dissulfurirhabdus thermomarina]|uniref:Hydrogenase formation protein HypD n=1 Tax=Dissulfurirhabdus thermomarina TaxID=1765737 RepID=A0A6N9TQ77_DISTH|nr:hydrogenase formation protein HypD [Dissulfurirhabdus thermomarina]NDY42600.1 hydrogenase formation protein HypD [Dissulfurirhabdus thermomarina]NMX22655.1 hydrogenase formation protein HypD [Dissulfurirhabdus thermomarina]
MAAGQARTAPARPAAFRDPGLAAAQVAEIRRLARRPLRFMEVCGTHTVSIFRHGLRELLPPEVELISGPGCPVCVTDQADIDALVDLAGRPGVRLATFGDLVRVPGGGGSLAEARARGARVEVVYSPMDALALAEARPHETVVFAGVGFETTAPAVAATVIEADRRGLANFALWSAHKVMPPALRALLADPGLRLDGLLCPGHVSTIVGAGAWRGLAADFGIPCVVAGFEPLDVLEAIRRLVLQAVEGRAEADNAYPRAVTEAGNPRALAVMAKVFVPVAARWRGLGEIPASGLALAPAWRALDAAARFDLDVRPAPDPPGCRCGDVLRGRARPPECPHFGRRCTPARPVGPCMVSSEGACSAWYRFGAEGAR